MVFKHRTGTLYKLIGVGTHVSERNGFGQKTKSNGDYVVYQALDGDYRGRIFVRDPSAFTGKLYPDDRHKKPLFHLTNIYGEDQCLH